MEANALTIEPILVEIPQWSQWSPKAAEGLWAEEVPLAGLEEQRAPLEVHVHLTQLLHAPTRPAMHEHRSTNHQVI